MLPGEEQDHAQQDPVHGVVNCNTLADVEDAEIEQWDGAEGEEKKIGPPVLIGESDGVMRSLQREKQRKVEA